MKHLLCATLLGTALLATPHISFAHKATAVKSDGICKQPWSRATAGQNGAVFMSLGCIAGDTLLKAESDVAERVELHTHIQEGDTFRMREVDSIEVPAGKQVELKPGGLHLMLMGLKKELEKGQSFEVTLHFKKAGTQKITVPVKSAGAKSASCGCCASSKKS